LGTDALILIRQPKADLPRNGILLALDIEITLPSTKWISLAKISEDFLLVEIIGKPLNYRMKPKQISRVFKLLEVKADLDPIQISWHSTSMGSNRKLLV